MLGVVTLVRIKVEVIVAGVFLLLGNTLVDFLGFIEIEVEYLS